MRLLITQYRKPAGYTLVELMISVALIGILAAIAMPAYTNYILKANRQSGMDILITQQYRIQNYLLQFNKSSDTLLTTLCGNATDTNAAGITGYVCGGDGQYLLTSTALTPSGSYTLTALPKGRQEQDGTLLLTYDAPTRKLTRQHITLAGDTVDGWDFQPGK